MAGFIGRERELAALDRALRRVGDGGRAGRPGRAILMRGRRRVGKSRLAEEFVDRAGVPHLYFTASAQQDVDTDLRLFTEVQWLRESLRRLPGDLLPEGTAAIGGYRTRTNDVEIDVVGADREPVAKHVTVVGSIKWLSSDAFDAHDLARLMVHRSRLPGADDATPLLAVSRGGTTTDGVLALGPDDLMAAWRP